VRIVLDTNGVVSAIVFKKGRFTWLRDAWQNGTVTPLIDKLSFPAQLQVILLGQFHRSTEFSAFLVKGTLKPANIGDRRTI
jgi:predicted nucleic acid-binding protein